MTLQPVKSFRIGSPQIAMLEKLSNANGVSGNEQEIRTIIQEYIKPLVDEIKVDAMGNLLALKHARSSNPVKVMMAAHMDEVGFMLVEEDGDGLFSFALVGGVDERQLLSKEIGIGKERVPGIIGSKPIHLLEADEIHNKVSVHSMRVDVAPANSKKVKPGDYGTFSTRFKRAGELLFGKALDDRLGVACLIEILKVIPDHIEFLAAFTVQEEIGLRGARVAAYAFNPDLAIVLDSTPAFDMPRPDGLENTQYNSRLGAGPAIYLSDAGTLSDPRLIRFLVQTAEKNQIPFQFRQPGGGGTDAGAIHKTRSGIPSVSVSIPGRYAHTPVLLASIQDWENTIRLLIAALKNINLSILSEERG
jgi:putative aminopeptidase FrvX